MADFTVSRLGQINGSGSTDALFLKMFSGEVSAIYQKMRVFADKIRVRTIPHGKEAQFPAIGRLSASYHAPGTEIPGHAANHAERTIKVDNVYLADVAIAQIDELKNHYDVRAPYAAELAYALADAYDSRAARTIARAARTQTPIVTGGDTGLSGAATAGSALRNASAGTNAGIFTNLVWKAIELLDVRNVKEDGRYLAVKPAQYYLLLANPSSGSATAPLVINRDWGGDGGYASGEVNRIGNVTIVKSNNVPSTDLQATDLASATGGNSYAGDFQTTLALLWQSEAIGGLSLMNITTEASWQIRYQTYLMLAKSVQGFGVLRPECAMEITSAAIADQNDLTP